MLRDDLAVVPEAISLARATLAVIRRNLAWAFGYNIAAIPLAAAGLLNPLIAGAGDGGLVGVRGRQQRATAPIRPGQPGSHGTDQYQARDQAADAVTAAWPTAR